jgi:hypothetical protein
VDKSLDSQPSNLLTNAALLDIWRTQPSFFEHKSFKQIVQVAGDGRLLDGSSTSRELREWLAAIPLTQLKSCIEECLAGSFAESGQALQDAVNELGTRLGFTVTYGRYRGSKVEVGNDGLWIAKDGFGLLVEIKTTDAYRINLDTIAGYRNKLISENRLDAQSSSILIAVGRQDTGDLEAQIRGSRHAWDVRLVSLESLIRLAEVKEELTDSSTGSKINQLLRPVEYTRLDAIVELLFAAKIDLETPKEAAPPDELTRSNLPADAKSDELEKAREVAVARISKALSRQFARKSPALRTTEDGTSRLVCLASQKYKDPGASSSYWYGFTPSQCEYLRGAKSGWLGLACVGSENVYLVPLEDLLAWLPSLLTTPSGAEGIRHWHLILADYGAKVDLVPAGGGALCDLVKYRLKSGG